MSGSWDAMVRVELAERLGVLRELLGLAWDAAAARDDWERADVLLVRMRRVSFLLAEAITACVPDRTIGSPRDE
jgi:hypothetical protein